MTSKQFRVLMALTVVAGFLGGAVSNLLLRGTPAQAAGTVQQVVKARSFEVVDGMGKTRATLGIHSDGHTRLDLLDATGKMRAELGLLPNGSPGLVLKDTAGNARAALVVETDGNPDLWMKGSDGGVAKVSVSHDDGPNLELLGGGPNIASVGLYAPFGGGTALDMYAGLARASLSLDPNGKPKLSMVDLEGKTDWSAP